MKSINDFSTKAASLSSAEMNKARGGLMKVSSIEKFVYNGFEYTVTTLDRGKRTSVVTKMVAIEN